MRQATKTKKSNDLDLKDIWRLYYDDPVGFAYNVIQIKKLDPWQEWTLESLAKHQHVAVAGGTGIGKETTAACAIIWFLLTRPHARVACLSASAQQVQVALWQEIHKWIFHSKYLPRYLDWSPSTVKVKGYGERWQAFQSIAAKRISAVTGEAQAEGGAGIHGKHLLIVISEASGVEEAQWDAKLATLTGGSDNRCLAIGNPVRRSGRFYEIFTKPALCKPREQIDGTILPPIWLVKNVSHLESSFVSPMLRANLIAMSGEESALVQAKVFGQFPVIEDGKTVFGYDEVEDAFKRSIEDNTTINLQIGVDVARYGEDETVIFTRRGRVGIKMECFKRTSVMDTCALVVREATRWWRRPMNQPRAGEWALTPVEFMDCQREVLIVVDDGGVGGGVTDHLKAQGWRVCALNNAHPARNGRSYKSRGDEIWMVDGKIALGECAIPRDDKLQHQLCTREVRYDTATGTKRRMETKDEMQRRGLPSPDRADAMLLAFSTVLTADMLDFSRAFQAV
jgi:hypothetical protein